MSARMCLAPAGMGRAGAPGILVVSRILKPAAFG